MSTYEAIVVALAAWIVLAILVSAVFARSVSRLRQEPRPEPRQVSRRATTR
jgi:hypothetical protein